MKQIFENCRPVLRLMMVFFVMMGQSCTSNAAEEPVGFDIIVEIGDDVQMCQDIAQEMREKRKDTRGYCGIPIPANNPDYKLPDWVDLDPALHIDMVRKIYFWHNISRSRRHPLYAQQISDLSVILPEFYDIYWPKAEPFIMSYIENGEIELWESQLDVDADGIEERVYKMTRIVTVGAEEPPWVIADRGPFIMNSCQDIGFQDSARQYLYFVEPEELPVQNYSGLIFPSRLEIGGFFTWRDEVYRSAGDLAIYKPTPTDIQPGPRVCAIRTLRRSSVNE